MHVDPVIYTTMRGFLGFKYMISFVIEKNMCLGENQKEPRFNGILDTRFYTISCVNLLTA